MNEATSCWSFRALPTREETRVLGSLDINGTPFEVGDDQWRLLKKVVPEHRRRDFAGFQPRDRAFA
jgi:hypothetical protein